MRGYLLTFASTAAFLVGCGGRESTSGAGTGGTAGAAGSATSTGSGGSGGTAATGGGGGTGGIAGGADGGGTCGGRTCGIGLQCCGDTCVNANNDINNCGGCGNTCPRPNPFCDNGRCGTPPCDGTTCAAGTLCCGSACCTDGQLCCNIPMGASALRCATPVNDTCPPGCPACICASPDTPVATPNGPRPIAALHEGDIVYSVDHGHVAAVPVQQTKRVAVDHHVVVRVVLANGSTLEISAPHPTADARRFGDLRAGDTLGGVVVVTAGVVPYAHEFTYDILPASDTGTYFAGGALIGSTLAAVLDVGICVSLP